MTLIRWHRAAPPHLSPFRSELNRLVTETQALRGSVREDQVASAFTPALDIVETATEYMVSVEIPGLSAAEIDIELAEDTLTLSGEKKLASLAEGESSLRSERRMGSFSRSLRLPDSIDAEKVTAECKSGVLSITIGKKEATLPRRIEVKAV